MPKLADGNFCQDQRLDRLFDWDDRNLEYPADKLLSSTEKKKARSYTWRVHTLLDQGVEGGCVGFAFAHELIASPKVWQLDRKDAYGYYYAAQKIDPWPGGEYPGASPLVQGTSLLAGAKTLKSLGLIEQYRWGRTVDEIARVVGHKGPFVLGCNWHTGMWDTDKDGYISPVGGVVGGHALVVNGVNHKREDFTVTNSWGPGWGVNGTARIKFEGLQKLLGGHGEACIPVGRAKQPKKPRTA